MALSQAATVAHKHHATLTSHDGLCRREAIMRLSQLGTGSILVPLFLALFGSALGQSFPGQGQGALWTEPNNVGSTAAVLYADAFVGSDPCSQINAAIGALPPTGGVIDARAFQGTLTCTSNPFPVATNLGTISLVTAGTTLTVTGTGTSWSNTAQASQVNAALFCGNPPGVFLGTIAAINVASQILTLTTTSLNSCVANSSYSITAKSGMLLLGNATYSIQSSWIVPDRWRIAGSGRGQSNGSVSPNGSGTSIQANTASYGPQTHLSNATAANGNPIVTGTTTTGWGPFLVGSMFTSGSVVQGVIQSATSGSGTANDTLTLSTNAQATRSGPYSIYPPLVQFAQTNALNRLTTPISPGISEGVSLSNLQVDCNGLNPGLGVQNWWAQEESYVQDVNISNCNGVSLDVETVTAQNSGPYSNIASSTTNTSGLANALTLCAELLSTSDLRGIHGLTCIGTINSTNGPNVGVDLSTTGVTLEDVHLEGYTIGIEVGLNAVTNNATIVNATGGAGTPGMATLVDIANNSTNALFVSKNEIGLFGLSTGGVPNILDDEIMGTVLTNTTDPSLAFYTLGQGSSTNRTRLTSSPNASNVVNDLGGVVINGGAATSNGSGGTVSLSGGAGSGTGNGGNISVAAGASGASGGSNGQLQVLQPFIKGTTVTAGDLECFSSANTVQDCSSSVLGNFIGVAASTTGNTAFVATHGVAGVNINPLPATAGHFICQAASGQATDSAGGCGVTRGVGIAITSATSNPVPVLLIRF